MQMKPGVVKKLAETTFKKNSVKLRQLIFLLPNRNQNPSVNIELLPEPMNTPPIKIKPAYETA